MTVKSLIEMPRLFYDNLIEKRAHIKCFYGGRSAARSHSVARALLYLGMLDKRYIICGRQFAGQIDHSIRRLLMNIIDEHALGYFYQPQQNVIRGSNGTEIKYIGLDRNPGTLKSMEDIDILWMEEAQYIKQEIIDLLMPTMVRNEGAETWVTMNVGALDDPAFKEFILHPRPGSIVEFSTFLDNPYTIQETLNEAAWLWKYDLPKYNHTWLGEPLKISEAVVFKDRYTIRDFTPPLNTIFYLGIDWGFSNDPFAFSVSFIDEENRTIYIWKAKTKIGLEIEDTPRFIEEIFPDVKKWMITADKVRPEMISYLRRRGFNIRKGVQGKDSFKEGVEFLKNFHIVIHPDFAQDAIYEYSTFSYKTNPKTKEILPLLEEKNDHVIASNIYAFEQYKIAASKETIEPFGESLSSQADW